MVESGFSKDELRAKADKCVQEMDTLPLIKADESRDCRVYHKYAEEG